MQIVYNKPGCYETIFKPGYYYIHLVGAQGGQCGDVVPSGGFSSGYIRVIHKKTFWVCVGGQGLNTSEGAIEGGFNGGGSGSSGIDKECGGSGGGMTDIRENQDEPLIFHLVAGGGGGDGHYKGELYPGGKGGGKEGSNGVGNGYGIAGSLLTLGGEGGYYEGNPSTSKPECKAEDGSIGQGGDSWNTAGGSTGGGGAGYYGGEGGADLAGGGGGCSYASSLINHWKTGYTSSVGDGFAFIDKKINICTCYSKNQIIIII